MADVYIKRHDTMPVVEAEIGYSSPTDDAALATALADEATVVSFIMKLKTDVSGTAKVNAPASVVEAANRIVRYQWADVDTDTAGVYVAEWEVKFPDGRVQTFPTTGYHEIEIVADLDDAGQA